jgi:hypothetical protein
LTSPKELRPHKLEIQNEKKLLISETKETFDSCIDRGGMALLTEDDKAMNAIKVLNNKGIRMRFVTAIDEGTMSFCRQIMKLGAEVFHNHRAKGNFEIVDGTDYLCYISDNGDRTQGGKILFHTKNKSFINIQQCLFDNLCEKAIPAKEKIKEIERGVRKDFTDTINEPAQIRKIVNDQLLSAKDEILLLFSTTNSFYRMKNVGMFDLLRRVPNDVTVKMLIQVANLLQNDTIQEELRESYGKIQVQYIAKPLQKKIMTVVVDQATSVAIEIKDDARKTFEEGSGTAIYSNSELIVSSCMSIFETLWIQSELDKRNKVKHAYFQMFKGLRLKEESYSRRWSSQNKEE